MYVSINANYYRRTQYVYVADCSNHRILRYNATGPGDQTGVVVAGGNGRGSQLNQLNYPTDVWVTPTGSLIVADYSNHRVLLFRPGSTQGVVLFGGNGEGSAMNQLNGPVALLVVDTNLVYVSDQYNHRVVARRCPELLL